MRPIDPYLRKQPWRSDGVGPSGRRLCCCGCGREVGATRSSSHSQECVARWKAHSDMSHIRWQVEHRDKGVCALCGTDTVGFQNRIARMVGRALGWFDRFWGGALDYSANWKVRRIHDILRRHKWPTSPRRWWEADHIVPVAEGGGGCDFNGYRTLCVPCHKAESKRLAGRLAEKRKAAKQFSCAAATHSPQQSA